jgi:beta-lactamase regulating signal transducer with metallopeptidase domain
MDVLTSGDAIMNAVVETINRVGGALVDFALPMLIQSSVLIVILLLIDAALRRRVRAVFRYWIWMLVLVKLVLPPSLGSPVSIGRWLGDPLRAPAIVLSELSESQPATRAAEPRLIAESVLSQVPPASVMTPAAPMEDPYPESVYPQAGMQPDIALADMDSELLPGSKAIPSTAAPAPSLSRRGLVFLSWAAVAAALLLLLVQRSFFVRGLVAQADEPGAAMQNAVNRCRTQIGLRREVILKLSAIAGSPAACGLFRPVILIPQSLAPRLEAHDLQAVLFHELAHIKRGDLWINLAQTLLQIVYFYNPLLWLANAIIRRTREQAVDEAVLVVMGEAAQQYPETLINIAKLAFRKRPALSLRLIGVVESRNALSARIRHILTRPLPKTARLGLLGLIVVSVTAVLLLPMAQPAQKNASANNNGPLDIRLVAVCPDGGGEFYDPNGKSLDLAIGPLGSSDGRWKSDEQHWDFILQVPAFDAQLLFPSVVWIRAAGTGSVLGASPPLHNPAISPSSLIISAEFDRTYSRSWFGFFARELPVDKVDLTLQYFYGARREALCTFAGPFTEGKLVQADEGRPYQLTPASVSSLAESQVKFHFTTNQPLESGVPILLYDKQGRRHTVNESGDIGGQGASLTCETEAVLWDQIVAITVGEKPYEVAFRNVVVRYPNRPPRTYAASWDRIAERLGRTGSSAQTPIQYDFRSADEAIAVLDVIRSLDQIRRAVKAIGRSRARVDRAALDEAARDKVRRAAASWLESPSVEVRAYGVELGLMAGLPEFVDPAFALLDYHDPTGPGWTHGLRSHVLGGLQRYMDKATPADIERLRRLALRGGDGALWNGLVQQCLRMSRQAAVSDMLWELAQDDRPWLWWPCVKALLERHDQRLKAYSDLPEPMKLHLFLASDTPPPGDEALAARAKALVPGLLTVETVRMYIYGWRDYHEAVARHLGHREATAVYISFLKELSEPEARWRIEREHDAHNSLYALVPALIRDINLWYGVNLGGLGVYDPNNPAHVSSVGPSPSVLAQLIAETLSWYEANQGQQLPTPNSDAGGSALVGPGKTETGATEATEGRSFSVRGMMTDQSDRPMPGEAAAKLPNGVTVRFLAYSQLTGEGLKWWTPNGEPATVPDVHEADVEGLGTILAFADEPPDVDLTVGSYCGGDQRKELDKKWRLGWVHMYMEYDGKTWVPSTGGRRARWTTAGSAGSSMSSATGRAPRASSRTASSWTTATRASSIMTGPRKSAWYQPKL